MVNTIKVFKKTSLNGKVTAYLSRRDFVDHFTHASPVDGVVVVDHNYLNGRKVFARVAITFRYGREEDEVMGVSFSKELELINTEVPARPPGGKSGKGGKETNTTNMTHDIECLLKKLGPDARPFCLSLPDAAPASVTLDPGHEGTAKTLGVTYELALYVSDIPEERLSQRNSVIFPVRKVQLPPTRPSRCPRLLVAKTFTLSPGKVALEVDLDRDVYHHGQAVEAHISINNASKKTVKHVTLEVLQHVEVTMTNTHFSRVVASMESNEGCPVIPTSRYSRSVFLTPLPLSTYGVALEGHAQDQDTCLASSTMMTAQGNTNDALGIYISYSLRVKLHCGLIGGDLTADLPFKLMHSDSTEGRAALKRTKSVDDDILIEEFRALRRGKSLTDELEE